MVRFLRIFLPVFGVACLIVWGGLSLYSRHLSARAAGLVSEHLDSMAEIDQAIEKGRELSASQLAELPGLVDVIQQDFGFLDEDHPGFYLVDARAFAALDFPRNPIWHPDRNQFVIHTPSGIVYDVAHPVSADVQRSQWVNHQVRPGAIPTTNPFIGWAPWATGLPYKDIEPTLAFALIRWNELEPEKGLFDLSAFEQSIHLDYCRANNIRLIFRIVLDYPNAERQTQLPAWLYDEIAGDGTWYDNDRGRSGFSPNYANKILIGAHQRLVAALGQRYNQDPNVAFIQLGSLGHYGEWHVSDRAGSMPSAGVTATYAEHYREAFPDKLLLFRRPVSQMQDLSAGLYNDMIGDTLQTDRWLNWIATGEDESFPGMMANPDFWQQGPSGGEFANGDPYRYLTDEALPETIRQIEASHTSLIGPAAPVKLETDEVKCNAATLLGKMGYHYRILAATYPRMAEPGKTITMQQRWENTGNSPMYDNWPVRIQLQDQEGQRVGEWLADTDIRTWLPGPIDFSTQIAVPAPLLPGIYSWSVAIIDPVTHAPGIQLANDKQQGNGSYTIGQIVVTGKK